MAQMPYQPMRSSQKAVTQDDMFRILAKHVPKGSLNPPQATQSPKEKSAPLLLQWHPPVRTHEGGAGYMESLCGRFRISKDGHKDAGFTYSAWKRLPDTIRDGRPYKEMPISLGVFKTLADAEAICRLENEKT